ncbi:MAG: excinuclease ABC subunit UvrC [Mariprofundaceae bacterium]
MWIKPPIELSTLPQEPGVYRMLDIGRKVLYVGKARNLRKRVSSYFQKKPDSPRTLAMLGKVSDIAVMVTLSEAEALLLEHNLIKQLKPRYNVLLKDAKTYPYLLLTDAPYPRFRLYRGNRDKGGEYFGPFPDAGSVRATLHTMQKIFRIRDCEDTVFRNRSRPCMQHQIGRCSAPCCDLVSREKYISQVKEALNFLKGRDAKLLASWEKAMQSASDHLDFETAAMFRDRIRSLRTMLSGSDGSQLPKDADAVVISRRENKVIASIGVRRSGRDLGTHIITVNQAQEVDETEILQSLFIERYRHEEPPADILLASPKNNLAELQRILKLLRTGKPVRIACPERGAKQHWLQQVARSAEQSLACRALTNQQIAFEALTGLLHLDEVPNRIAAVDNAHLGGKQMVSAIVYGGWNGPEKNNYRRYKLDDVPAGDDYAAMQRVLSRFFRSINEEAIPEPDLMLIDGGRGQLNIAMQTAVDHGLGSMKMLGVAKGASRKLGEETLWPGWNENDSGIGKAIKPGIHSPALLLIARLRDEAHRFAGSYMRKRKRKSMLGSALDVIPGIGKMKRTALLRHFGGIDGVKKASRKQLADAPGISGTLAERIFTSLR